VILYVLILLPIMGGLLAGYAGRRSQSWPRWISLATLVSLFVAGCTLWVRHLLSEEQNTGWFVETSRTWIPQLGIQVHLALDGVSLILVLLTAFLGIVATAASWNVPRERVGFFYFNMLWCLGGIVGVFLALDLFLFYCFWELMLIPMYLLIVIWGHENRAYAAMKFFLFTQLSGLFMLASIVTLAIIHGRNTGIYTFDYPELLGTELGSGAALWLLAGFFLAFAVKLPALFLHTWLPDAHTEAPTAGSIILAGLLLKTGAYGLLRFAVPLFPDAVSALAPVVMPIAAAGVLYGAVLAFSQTDLKRLIAYTSVSHMGFVLLGIFVWNELALQGVMVLVVCHGISTGALFFLAGALDERLGTRDLRRMGGLWSVVPRMGGVWLFFALASLGLPGLGNFVGEFLVLSGAYRVSVPMTAVSALGLVLAVIYALWMVQRAFFGENTENWRVPDITLRETVASAAMMAVLLWFGLHPQTFLDASAQGLRNIERHMPGVQTAGQIAPLTRSDDDRR
jgi:NADH-quinone oxidoreductase subunit M